ncbi:MAG: orotidine-5'-phosphate decarboxylase [Rickettsiales bacterium]|nr:orotidine-5'-phosphate decarboxylase [Rickettsiales bacterium]
MTSRDKLIVALDFSDFPRAMDMIEKLGDEVEFYKVGLELLTGNNLGRDNDCFNVINYLKQKNKKIFVDFKFHDISNTVGAAVRNLSKLGVDLMTIHCGSKNMMKAAADNKGDSKVIAVTVLTNLDEHDLGDMGFNQNLSLDELVLKKANLAIECGIDGVVSSALRAKNLRDNLGNDFLIVSPGIRLGGDVDDQKQVADVKAAIENGVSYLVVGRPITKAINPKESAKIFQSQISQF